MAVTVLLIISFMVHLLLILAVIVLFQRRSVERMNLPTIEEDVQTIHSSIEAFVNEMEKENERLYEQLIEYVKNKDGRYQEDMAHVRQRINELEREITHLRDHVHVNQHQGILDSEIAANGTYEKQQGSSRNKSRHEADPSKSSFEPTPSESDRYEQVRHLHVQGFSNADIAKILRIGNGEVQLITNMLRDERKNKID